MAGLLVLEGAVRGLHLGPQITQVRTDLYRLSEDPVLRYELEPGASVPSVQINSEGMRDDEPRPGSRAIALVGDSIAFGYGADQSSTAAAWMERVLNHYYRTPRPFDVLNYGVTGYNITQDLRMLERRAEQRDFEAVLVFYCLNDPQDYSFELDQLRSRMNLAEREYFGREAAAWAGRSRLWSLLRLEWDQRTAHGQQKGGVRPEPDWAQLQTPSWARYFIDLHRAGPGWDRVTSAFAGFGEFSRREGVPVYVVIFPVMKQLDDYPLGPVHERVAGAAQAAGLRPIDLTAVYRAMQLRARGSGIFDELHPNAVGYAFAALSVLRGLLGDDVLHLGARDLSPVTEADPPLGAWARWLGGLATAE